MNAKRFEQIAGILRDLGLAAVIGGVGDLVVNAESGRGRVDAWGIVCGIALLTVSIYVSGLEPTRRKG